MNVEVAAKDGRIDAVIETDTHIYIFEFKKDKTLQHNQLNNSLNLKNKIH